MIGSAAQEGEPLSNLPEQGNACRVQVCAGDTAFNGISRRQDKFIFPVIEKVPKASVAVSAIAHGHPSFWRFPSQGYAGLCVRGHR
jgi:hypothetical protein